MIILADKNIYCGIYKITCLLTGKSYIGKSVNVINRWLQYYRLEKRTMGKKLFNSLKKYGVDNHIFELIEECEVIYLSEKEIFYIEKFNTFLKGLNSTSGGEHFTHSDKTKKLISESLKGRISPLKGRTRNYKGRTSPMKGRKHTEESKQISSLKRKGKTKKGLPIIDESTNQTWISASEAGRYFNVSSVTIQKWIKNNKNNLKYI